MVEESKQIATAVRQLKIKTGSATRMVKDHKSYKKEKIQLEEKIEKMKADGAEEGNIKRVEQDLADTIAMLPNLKTKIEEAVGALEEVIGTTEEEAFATAEWKEATAEWAKAQETIKEANEYI